MGETARAVKLVPIWNRANSANKSAAAVANFFGLILYMKEAGRVFRDRNELWTSDISTTGERGKAVSSEIGPAISARSRAILVPV